MIPKREDEFISKSVLKQFAIENFRRITAWFRSHDLEDWESRIHRAVLDKPRELIKPPPSIYILEKVLALGIEGRIQAKLAREVVSFQKGRSSIEIVRDLAEAGRGTPGPLHVIRRDIEAYTDSIPLHAQSPLWSLLNEVGLLPFELSLLRRLLRPVLRRQNEPGSFCRNVGISTGSALTPLIANLYLTPLDRELASIPGAFYRRYGDDLIFCHPDRSTALHARSTIRRTLTRLGLQEKESKARDLLWTARGGAGRIEGFEERDTIEILGMRVTRRGVRLPPSKMKHLLVRTRMRLSRAIAGIPPEATSERASRAVEVVHALFSREGLAQDPLYRVMIQSVDDPGQWRELDHEIFKALATLTTGQALPLAFRSYPPRRWIREFGLKTPGYLRQVYVRF
ncbi:MAG: hypothetical protein KGP28_05900 [Bdellovibrionales bacterium]|nr:hypothetical protein [Bdellovibrionales bacterium]